MEKVLERLRNLDESQLRTAVLGAGIACGPITFTTRVLFEKKLARILLEKEAGEDAPGPNGLLGAECKDCDQSPERKLTVEDNEKEKCASSHEETAKSSPESQIAYYGVCPQRDAASGIDEKMYVYVDIKKALKAMEGMRDSRLKSFSTRKEAEDYSKGMHEDRQSISSPTKGQLIPESEEHVGQSPTKSEKANDYPSPKTQDLTAKLRRAAEEGDEVFFKQLVWDNPRFLIGCGDNPTIVHLGCRYNILHVAAKENQPGIVRVLLNTLENPEFMRRMYQDDEEETLHHRIRYIVDLYLNTPDQTSNDTPLHLACKFGFPEVVDILCSHPITNKHRKNKFSQKPSDVVCQRQNKTFKVKNKIMDYMEDRCYVRLLRDTDNSFQPTISLSFTPNPLEVKAPEGGPTDPMWGVSAYVGPLSPAKGENFYKLWRNPSRDKAQYFHNILKSDPSRGAERVGRELAHSKQGHLWAEYWHFLQGFVDLSTEEGLNRLEKYLEGKDSSAAPSLQSGGDSSTCPPMEGRHISPLTDSSASPVCNLLTRFEETKETEDTEQSVPAPSAPDTEGISLDLANINFWNKWEKNSGKQKNEDEESKGSSEYFTADDSSEPSTCLTAEGRYRKGSVSSYSSVQSLEDATDDTMLTSESPSHKLFIEGESPTRLDREVMSAVQNVNIDPSRHPLITKWKNTILSYPSAHRLSWPSPGQKKSFVKKQDFTCTKLKFPSSSQAFAANSM